MKEDNINTLNFNVSDVVHYFNIKVYDKRGGNLIEFLSWNNMRWETRLKWNWYFTYRAALAQVNYPKYIVDCNWGNDPASGKTLEQIRHNKLRAKRSKITEYRNKLERVRLDWKGFFPIEEDIPYQRTVKKIEQLEAALIALEQMP